MQTVQQIEKDTISKSEARMTAFLILDDHDVERIKENILDFFGKENAVIILENLETIKRNSGIFGEVSFQEEIDYLADLIYKNYNNKESVNYERINY